MCDFLVRFCGAVGGIPAPVGVRPVVSFTIGFSYGGAGTDADIVAALDLSVNAALSTSPVYETQW